MERKKLEDAVRESEQRLFNIINFLPDAILAIDTEGKVIAWNKAVEELTGVRAEDMLGKKNYDYAIPFYGFRRPILIDLALCPQEKVEKQYVFICRQKDVLIAETDVPCVGGKNLFLWGKAGPIYDSRGNLIGAIESIRDITEWKRIKEELQKSEKLYRAIIEDQTELVSRWKPNKMLTFVNDAYCRYFGEKAEDLIGKPFSHHIHLEDGDCFNAYAESFSTARPVATIEHRVIDREGKIRWIQWTDRALLQEDGSVLEIQSVGRDITLRREAESQLQKSLKEKEILLKEIHHRVKNNLQVISSLLNLQSRRIKDPLTFEMFRDSRNRIMSMALLHERLYNSKDLANIDFSSYIQRMARQLFVSYDIDVRRISLNISVTDVFMSIDEAIPCGLIINELISNALKHAFPRQQKGTVDVSFRREESNVTRLIVQDDGAGFPGTIDFRNTETLGLQLVNDLVHQLCGSVAMETRNGTGTVFTVVFPI